MNAIRQSACIAGRDDGEMAKPGGKGGGMASHPNWETALEP